MLKSMKDRDPAPKPMLALPVETIEAAAAVAFNNRASVRRRAAAEMITVAFFFLLRVGEYTKSSKDARTVPFRVKDVLFRRQNRILPNNSPLAVLLQADSVTLWLDNQKNGQRGATLHHTAVPGQFCPVKALARRVSSIVAINPDPTTPLSFVSPGIHLTAPNIKDGVINAAKQTRLPDRGYPLSQIGTHSLRASGAMALKLNGYHQTEIMKLGRWTSTTFLTYIHSQIAALSAGIATRMTRRIEFFNVEGPTA
jgi:hypothetical protein